MKYHQKKLIQKIRDEVFIKEQGISKDIEFDGKDDDSCHVLVFSNKHVIATGRMQKDGRIGRIAVLKEHRKKGLGTMVMKAFIEEAKNKRYKKVYLDSQLSAVAFYEKLGFVLSSEVFVKAEIEHITMNKVLA